MFGKRTAPVRRRSKTRLKPREEKARRVPKGHKKPKRIKPVKRRRQQEAERVRHYREALEQWRVRYARFGTAIAALQTATAARAHGVHPIYWAQELTPFYEPYREKVNWKKEGF